MIEYIEENLFSPLTDESLAQIFLCSKSKFRQMFVSFFNIPVDEYIRKRRLSVIAVKLARRELTIKEAAERMAYKNTESFLRAYRQFHGRNPGADSKQFGHNYFNSFKINLFITGGDIVIKRKQKYEKFVLTGFKTRFSGLPQDRFSQEQDFFNETRERQENLYQISKKLNDEKKIYTVIDNIDAQGFDFAICYDCGGIVVSGFDEVLIPENDYLVFETQKDKYPTRHLEALWKTLATEYAFGQTESQSDGGGIIYNESLRRFNSPIIEEYHWYLPESSKRFERYIDVLIPLIATQKK